MLHERTPPAGAAMRDGRFKLALAALALIAALPSAFGIPGRWLWLDELLSVAWSVHGPWATLMTVLRFDVHPPLYYMQLTLWMLFGQGDTWLMANAALWHVAAVVILGWTAAGWFGTRVGLGAALLLALSPAALEYADQVRMYSFVMALVVWAWHAQARWLEDRGGRFGWLWMIVSQAAVTNSHTGGLLMLSGVVILGAVTLAAEGRWRRAVEWLLIEVAVLVLSVVALAFGFMRGVSHLASPDLADVWTLWVFLAGGEGTPGVVAAVLGVAVLAGLVAGGLRDRRLARDAVTLILVPLLLAGLLSHLHKSVWIERLFVTVIPFVCLCLARAALAPAAPAPRRARAGVALFLALALAWGGVAAFVQVPRGKGDGYRLAAEAVRAVARPGDTVLVETAVHYWCFMWYFARPDWIDARQAYVETPEWTRLMARLPAATARIIGLGDRDVRREVDGLTAMLWDPDEPLPMVPSGDVWLVRLRGSPPVSVPERHLAGASRHIQFDVQRWSR